MGEVIVMNGILDINNITVKYGKNTVVNNFNFKEYCFEVKNEKSKSYHN